MHGEKKLKTYLKKQLDDTAKNRNINGCRRAIYFEKIIRTIATKKLGLLVDEKKVRRSKTHSEAE